MNEVNRGDGASQSSQSSDLSIESQPEHDVGHPPDSPVSQRVSDVSSSLISELTQDSTVQRNLRFRSLRLGGASSDASFSDASFSSINAVSFRLPRLDDAMVQIPLPRSVSGRNGGQNTDPTPRSPNERRVTTGPSRRHERSEDATIDQPSIPNRQGRALQNAQQINERGGAPRLGRGSSDVSITSEDAVASSSSEDAEDFAGDELSVAFIGETYGDSDQVSTGGAARTSHVPDRTSEGGGLAAPATIKGINLLKMIDFEEDVSEDLDPKFAVKLTNGSLNNTSVDARHFLRAVRNVEFPDGISKLIRETADPNLRGSMRKQAYAGMNKDTILVIGAYGQVSLGDLSAKLGDRVTLSNLIRIFRNKETDTNLGNIEEATFLESALKDLFQRNDWTWDRE